MRLSARKLLIFTVKFLTTLIVLALVWLILGPIYNALTVAVSNALFPLFEEPDISLLKPEGNSVAIYVRDPEKGPLLFGYIDYPHSGVIVLLALFLATPALAWRSRMRLIALALLLLVGIHSLFLIAKTRYEYVNIFGADLPIPDWLYWLYQWFGRSLIAISLIAPFALWVLLTWRSWLPKPAQHKSSRAMKEARP
jgi:hypothetical protein